MHRLRRARIAARTSTAPAADTKAWQLIQLTHPNRLRADVQRHLSGRLERRGRQRVLPLPRGAAGWLRIVVSRKDWGGKTGPSPVSILVAPLVITDARQPALSRTKLTIPLTIDSGQTKVCWLHAPADRFGAAVLVQNKFIPQQVDPTSGDVRVLGAEVSYQFFRHAPKHVTPNTCR